MALWVKGNTKGLSLGRLFGFNDIKKNLFMIIRIRFKGVLMVSGVLLSMVGSSCACGMAEKPVLVYNTSRQFKAPAAFSTGRQPVEKRYDDQGGEDWSLEMLKQALAAVLKPGVLLESVVLDEVLRDGEVVDQGVLNFLYKNDFYKVLPLNPLLALAKDNQQGSSSVAVDVVKRIVALGNVLCEAEKKLLKGQSVDLVLLTQAKQQLAALQNYSYNAKSVCLDQNEVFKVLEPLLQSSACSGKTGQLLGHSVNNIAMDGKAMQILITQSKRGIGEQESCWQSGQALNFKFTGFEGQLAFCRINNQSAHGMCQKILSFPMYDQDNQQIGYHRILGDKSWGALVMHMFFGINRADSAMKDYLFWRAFAEHKSVQQYGVNMQGCDGQPSVWEQWIALTKDKAQFAQALLKRFQASLDGSVAPVCFVQDTKGILAKFKAYVKKYQGCSGQSFGGQDGLASKYRRQLANLVKQNQLGKSPFVAICQALENTLKTYEAHGAQDKSLKPITRSNLIEYIDQLEQAMLIKFEPKVKGNFDLDYMMACAVEPCLTPVGEAFMAYLHQYLTKVWDQVIKAHGFNAERIKSLCSFEMDQVMAPFGHRLQVLEVLNQLFEVVDKGAFREDGQMEDFIKQQLKVFQEQLKIFNLSYEAFWAKLKQQLEGWSR